MSVVRIEQATVYRAPNGRRFFTIIGACNEAARAALRKAPCDCEQTEYDYRGEITAPGSICRYHDPLDPFRQRAVRLIAHWHRVALAEQERDDG